jgi:hypothetical protein
MEQAEIYGINYALRAECNEQDGASDPSDSTNCSKIINYSNMDNILPMLPTSLLN